MVITDHNSPLEATGEVVSIQPCVFLIYLPRKVSGRMASLEPKVRTMTPSDMRMSYLALFPSLVVDAYGLFVDDNSAAFPVRA